MKRKLRSSGLQRIGRNRLMTRETCVECGKSVAFGSGRFVNRVPVLDDCEVRAENYPHPEGVFMCAECDESAW